MGGQSHKPAALLPRNGAGTRCSCSWVGPECLATTTVLMPWRKVHAVTEVQLHSFLTSALDGSGQLHADVVLPQSRSGCSEKGKNFLHQSGLDLQITRPVVQSLYQWLCPLYDLRNGWCIYDNVTYFSTGLRLLFFWWLIKTDTNKRLSSTERRTILFLRFLWPCILNIM
jgi:hypothetical protein